MPSMGTIQDYAKAINSCWHKTTDSVLDTAALCAEASKRFRKDAKLQLIKQLDFSAATFSKLVTIGEQPSLKSDPIKSLLPPNYSIVYRVAKLSPKELDLAIKDGVIAPSMSRADFDAWIAGQKGPKEEVEEKERVVATLRVPVDFDEEKAAQLEQALEKLRSEFGVAVERPKDAEAEALNRMVKHIDDHIRKGARRYIASLKRQRLQGARHLTPAIRKRLWGYAKDEVEIPADATWEQVRTILDYVGNGDQFERLRDEALRLYGVPASAVEKHPDVDHEEAMAELREVYQQYRETLRVARGGKVKKLDLSGVK